MPIVCYNIIRGDIMRDLKNYEDLYLITEDGVIYSKDKVCYNPRYGKYIRKGKKIKTTLKRGYLTCVINGEMKCVHRLLYETYVSDIPYDCVIHHINEDKLDNRVSNLICMTRDEHISHHNKIGKIYGNRKRDLQKHQIEQIIKLSKNGLSNREVAKIVGCGKSTVQKIYKKYREEGGLLCQN